MIPGIESLQWLLFAYVAALNLGYLALNALSFAALRHYAGRSELDAGQDRYTGLEPPVSILVPAYNEEATIAHSVRSILQLEYPEFEVIVVNDGSRDRTLDTLMREFELRPFPDAIQLRLANKPLRGVYRSAKHANLRVIDKDNGGKADALNAGINAARCPLFCAVDADSVLQRQSLWRVVEPFMNDPRVVASGGTVRIANGCTVEGGFVTRVGLPKRPLALVQIVEYLRAFLFGRLGWSALNAMLVISGAFGVFRRDAVIRAGGYRTDTVGEDMELVVRLHRLSRLRGEPYRIVYIPDPVCWTEAPESLRVLKSQRARWQRGLLESLAMNRELLFHRRGGMPGWIAMPFAIAFEALSPLLELGGYLFMLAGALLGGVSWSAAGAFFVLAVGLGMLLSVNALLLEELSFHVYARFRHTALLVLVAVLENFGYRQIVGWYRLVGLARWALGSEAHWGKMTRSASWQKK